MVRTGSFRGSSTLKMPDNSIECLLGRMEQRIEDIKHDLEEIKEEQKRLAVYIDTQKIGAKVLITIFATLGGIFVYYKEHLENIIFGKVSP